jgi:hypothetical protein
MQFNWKISEIKAKDGLITQVRYHVTAEENGFSVDTEGYWNFGDPVLRKPFDQVTEQDVIDWVKQDAVQHGENVIESRLAEQLANMEHKTVLPPWVPQVFTPNLG